MSCLWFGKLQSELSSPILVCPNRKESSWLVISVFCCSNPTPQCCSSEWLIIHYLTLGVIELRSTCQQWNAHVRFHVRMCVSVFLQTEGCVSACSLLAVYRSKLNEPCPWLDFSIVAVLERGSIWSVPSVHHSNTFCQLWSVHLLPYVQVCVYEFHMTL